MTTAPAELPKSNCLMVAAATPLTAELRPDAGLLANHVSMLFGHGCDGIALFGTTGEGTVPVDGVRAVERGGVGGGCGGGGDGIHGEPCPDVR